MHISEIEKARLEKDHQMRYGYQIQNKNNFPHNNDVNESQYIHKDMENKHAREINIMEYCTPSTPK